MDTVSSSTRSVLRAAAVGSASGRRRNAETPSTSTNHARCADALVRVEPADDVADNLLAFRLVQDLVQQTLVTDQSLVGDHQLRVHVVGAGDVGELVVDAVDEEDGDIDQ